MFHFFSLLDNRRFFFLSRNLTFDDPEDRKERWKKDRFAAAREIFEQWNDILAQAVEVGKYTAIDECMYACRIKIGFKQYNPSKPARYGLLFKVKKITITFTTKK